jgi:hypothetical protein
MYVYGQLWLYVIIYALNNPQASYNWSNSITYGIYLGYVVAAVYFIAKGLHNKD